MPFSVREGINVFLAGFVPTENLRFRPTELSFKVRCALNVLVESGAQCKRTHVSSPCLLPCSGGGKRARSAEHRRRCAPQLFLPRDDQDTGRFQVEGGGGCVHQLPNRGDVGSERHGQDYLHQNVGRVAGMCLDCMQ